MNVVSSSRRIPLGIPLHSNAGLRQRGLGAFDPFSAIVEIAGGIFGGIFGNNAAADRQNAELSAQRAMAKDQLDASTAIARLQAAMGMRQIDAAVTTERIRAANELAALDTAYNAQLSAQRVKKQLASEALSAQLVSQTQSGIFGLATTGIEASSAVSRQYPKSATTTLVFLVLGTATAIAFMRRPGKRSRRRKGGGRRRAAVSTAPSWTGSSSPSTELTLGAA